MGFLWLALAGAAITAYIAGYRSWWYLPFVFGGIALAVLYLRGVLIEIEDNQVVVRNLLGAIVRVVPISSLGDLGMHRKQLVYLPTGTRIATLGMGVNPQDRAELMAELSP